MKLRPRHAALSGLIALAAAAPAVATDGNLYYAGPPANYLEGTRANISQPQPNTWQIELTATTNESVGQKFAMSWGCTVPGSEIAYVNWSALRLAAPSALAAEVVTNAGLERHDPDVIFPQSPSGGVAYSFAPGPGRCSATFQLRQTQAGAQHRRIYWIGHPHAYFRDVQAPSAVMRSVTQGWLNAGTNHATVNWWAADNYGNDGMLAHTIWVGGLPKWAAAVGQGDHSATVDLTGVVDGAHAVLVDVAGDGTGPGQAATTIYVDRTAPVAAITDAQPTVNPGIAAVNWQSADATSGVLSSQLEVNTASDGTLTGEWKPVGGATTGGGIHSSTLDLSTFGNGHHAIRARVTDRAGNVGVSAPSRVVVDTTPPTITLAPTPTGHVRSLSLEFTLADNLAAHWGLGTTRIEANIAPGGSPNGEWIALRPAEALHAGQHRVVVPLTGLTDGVHLVRIATSNGGPLGGLVGVNAFTVNVDQTSPTVTDVTFRHVSPSRIDVGWIGNDARAGVARARVEWLDTSVWRPLSEAPAANGAGLLPIDIAQLPLGPQQLRVVIGDAAGNETIVTATSAVAQDHTPPALTGLRLDGGPPWRVSWNIAAGEVGACKTQVLISGPQTAGQWHEVASTATALGAQSVVLPVDGFAPGAYRVQVRVCDAVGNTATAETAGLQIGAAAPAAAGSSGAPGSSRLATARLAVRLPGVRAKSVDGRSRYVARLSYGQRTRVTGRLLDSGGVPIRGTMLDALVGDSQVGEARTAADGTFTIVIRPGRSGTVRFATDDGGERVTLATTADVTVRVSPTVSFSASSRTAVALGAPVVFTGRVTPGPRQLVGTHRKTVVLEWRDPARRTWRPVLNATLRDDGTYRVAWRFQARGRRIPMRLRVPYELGWNLDERTSRAITITVR